MNESSDIAPYRIRGRLADVIAAIQVMAAAKRTGSENQGLGL